MGNRGRTCTPHNQFIFHKQIYCICLPLYYATSGWIEKTTDVVTSLEQRISELTGLRVDTQTAHSNAEYFQVLNATMGPHTNAIHIYEHTVMHILLFQFNNKTIDFKANKTILVMGDFSILHVMSLVFYLDRCECHT